MKTEDLIPGHVYKVDIYSSMEWAIASFVAQYVDKTPVFDNGYRFRGPDGHPIDVFVSGAADVEFKEFH